MSHVLESDPALVFSEDFFDVCERHYGAWLDLQRATHCSREYLVDLMRLRGEPRLLEMTGIHPRGAYQLVLLREQLSVWLNLASDFYIPFNVPDPTPEAFIGAAVALKNLLHRVRVVSAWLEMFSSRDCSRGVEDRAAVLCALIDQMAIETEAGRFETVMCRELFEQADHFSSHLAHVSALLLRKGLPNLSPPDAAERTHFPFDNDIPGALRWYETLGEPQPIATPTTAMSTSASDSSRKARRRNREADEAEVKVVLKNNPAISALKCAELLGFKPSYLKSLSAWKEREVKNPPGRPGIVRPGNGAVSLTDNLDATLGVDDLSYNG